MVVKFLEYESICPVFFKVNRTWFVLESMKFLSARAGATQPSSVFMQIWFASGKSGTDQKTPGKFSNIARAELYHPWAGSQNPLINISFILKGPQINGVHVWFKLSLLLCQGGESPEMTDVNLFPLRNVKYQMTQLFLFWNI